MRNHTWNHRPVPRTTLTARQHGGDGRPAQPRREAEAISRTDRGSDTYEASFATTDGVRIMGRCEFFRS